MRYAFSYPLAAHDLVFTMSDVQVTHMWPLMSVRQTFLPGASFFLLLGWEFPRGCRGSLSIDKRVSLQRPKEFTSVMDAHSQHVSYCLVKILSKFEIR